MTTYLGKSCSFCLPRVPFVNCRQFMYLVISLLVLRAGYGISLYQFLIIAYLFTSQGELIVYPCSGVRCRRCRCRGRCCCRRRQQCLNIFSSETAWPIKAKLYVEPPWGGGTKVYINGPGHMAKMAAMPIYDKNL